MSTLRYVSSFVLAAVAAWSFFQEGLWTFAFPIIAFVAVPLAEVAIRPDPTNLPANEEQLEAHRSSYTWVLRAVLLVQYGLLALFLTRVMQGDLSALEWTGVILTMGIFCGIYGINIAHELGHRRSAVDQRTSQALLLSTLYMHFFIEHNRGHHAHVATPDDPATAREGEGLYRFWIRSITGSFWSAWMQERDRLQRAGQSPWSWHNQMIRFQVIQGVTVALVGIVLGSGAMWSFVAAAAIGIVLLETINYVEHYGIVRKKRNNGRYEPVRPHHSWNSDHPIGRALLMNLPRHSDHHANARRPFQILRHIDGSPQLPTGYPGMVLLAVVPPLFVRIMRPKLEQWRTQVRSA